MPIGMTFNDISAVLTEINKAATGQETTSDVIDTSSFVSVAEATLRTGYDNVLNAISQVMTKILGRVRHAYVQPDRTGSRELVPAADRKPYGRQPERCTNFRCVSAG